MKTRKLTVLILTLAMLALCACDAQPTEPTETPTNVPETSETAETTAPTESEPATEAPTTEPTEPTTEATEPITEAPDPKEDIRYYPYPLLEMTAGEIMEKYGDLRFVCLRNGGTSCYYSEQLSLYLLYNTHEVNYEGLLPKPEEKPDAILLEKKSELYPEEYPGSNYEIYPGLRIGYSPKNLADIEVKNIWGISLVQGGYSVETEIDGYTVNISFNVPDWVYERYFSPDPESSGLENEYESWKKSYINNINNAEILSVIIENTVN